MVVPHSWLRGVMFLFSIRTSCGFSGMSPRIPQLALSFPGKQSNLFSLQRTSGLDATRTSAMFRRKRKIRSPSTGSHHYHHHLAATPADQVNLSTDTKRFTLPNFDRNTRTSAVSAAAFIIMDIIFRKLFASANISFPSSLAGCGALFVFLLATPRRSADSIFAQLSPGSALLAKWLPVFFVPSLVTLPLTQNLGSSLEFLKVATIIVGGFFVTLLSTAGSVVGIRKLRSKKKSGILDAVMLPAADVAAAVEPTADQVTEIAKSTVAAVVPTTQKAFPKSTLNLLLLSAASSGVLAVTSTLAGTASQAVACLSTLVFMLSSTLASFVFGSRLPKDFTQLVHPLVTCTSLMWLVLGVFARLTHTTFRSTLGSYKTGSFFAASAPLMTGAGDVLLFLLGPSVISFAMSMYGRRQLMKENLPEVATAVTVSTFGGVFGTALAVRLLGIGNPSLRLSLLSRNITSPLAMAIAGILGADLSLAVVMVVVTGLIGANFGASILDAFGIKDAVARGLGIGAAAHGLGTAAFANEEDAFPFAAIAMALTASATTVTVSIPFFKRLVMQIALGW